MYRFKYTYSNGVEEFTRIFTLEEIGQGWHFYVISDNPLLKDYKIVDRLFLGDYYPNTTTK